jgi:hypothetical protein
MDENKTTEEVKNESVEAQSKETAPVAAEAVEAQAQVAESERPAPATKAEVLERLKEIAREGGNIRRPDLEALKQAYYRYHSAEVVAAREEFVKNGGAAEDFKPAPDADEETFKAEYNLIRELRAKSAAEEEAEKQENLKRKQAIIEEIKTAAASPEEADKNYEKVKQLQAEWKEIKQVPAENATELWKTYQLYCEQFYDQLHLNYEARQYDFKKNLEAKLRLCEAAEKLAEESDVISAFHQLQQYHQEFREIGPVDKEHREEVWNRFKEASTVVNKRHQDHFTALKEKEEENLKLKTALCEKVEAIDVDNVKGNTDWDKLTKSVLEVQAEWRTIGFTPKKDNTQIFERFRAACDRFFQRKAEHFKTQREKFSANIEVKNKLAEAAEALKESTDWAATTNKLIALQKQWKESGPVPHKVSEAIWKRFNEACNYFFDKKNEATGDQRREEEANLEKKNSIIAELTTLLNETGDDLLQKVRDLQARWNEVGHVPFRKKEEIYQQYRAICDKLYDQLHVSARRRHVDNFRRKVSEKVGNELDRERARLQAAFEAKKTEIQNYETNLSFFSAKSSSGNSLVADIEKKVARLKEDLTEITEKIKAIRQQAKAETKKDEETKED